MSIFDLHKMYLRIQIFICLLCIGTTTFYVATLSKCLITVLFKKIFWRDKSRQ